MLVRTNVGAYEYSVYTFTVCPHMWMCVCECTERERKREKEREREKVRTTERASEPLRKREFKRGAKLEWEERQRK